MEEISLYNHGHGTNLIVKTAGNACDLNCTYCFEKGKSVPHSPMPLSVLEQAIQTAPAPCSLVMHGGEPLIVGKKRFQEYLDIISKYYPAKVNIVRVQTNGALLDEEWIDLLFNKNSHLKIEIAISLDGTERMNSLRIDRKGNSSFDRVLGAFRLLKEHGIKAGMLSVISKQSIPFDGARKYAELIQSIPNLAFVKINALLNLEDNELTDDSITPSEYSKFIIELGDWYIKLRLYEKFPLEPILSILQTLRGTASRYCNYSARKCFNYLSLYPDGSLGPCDCLPVTDFPIDYEAWDSFEEAIKYAVSTEKANKLWKLIEQCKDCDIHDFCFGGCLSHRFYFSENPKLSIEFCKSKRELYNAFSKFGSKKLSSR